MLYRAGGTETWHCALLPGIDRERFELVGLGILNANEYDPITADKIRRTCPVVVGPDALADLASNADILVSWGIAHPEDIFHRDRKRPFHIAVSHGDGTSDFTLSTLRAAAPMVDWFVAVSSAAKGGIPQERWKNTTVIPNGIDLSRLEPKIDRETQRRLWGIPRGAKVLGFLGRASGEKNPTALAEAVRCLPREWVGVFVGDGLELPMTKGHAFARAGTRVYFPGPVEPEQIGSPLNAFDVLVVPSHQEGYCQSLCEGWMAGVPVISTPVGIARQHPEWVWPLPLQPTGDQIAKAVLMADRPIFREPLPSMAEAARAEYGAERMIGTWNLFLTEVAQCRSVRSRSSRPSAIA